MQGDVMGLLLPPTFHEVYRCHQQMSNAEVYASYFQAGHGEH